MNGRKLGGMVERRGVSMHACMRSSFVRGRRFTAVAALTTDGIIAAGQVVEGSLRRAGCR
jgi:hypothetical protein